MGSFFLAIIIGFSAGVTVYCVAAFWIRPIGRYRKAKRQIALDLPVLLENLSGGSAGRKKKGKNHTRMKRLRQNGACLSELYNADLPYWYKLVLTRRKESPVEAAEHLLRLTNTSNKEHARQRIDKVNACLGFGTGAGS